MDYLVATPSVAPTPVAIIEAPSELGACDATVSLDGSLSYGAAARSFSSVTWGIASVQADQLTAADNSALTAQIRSKLPSSGNLSFQLPLLSGFDYTGRVNQSLPAGTYVFTLTITNWLGKSNTAQQQLRKKAAASPTLVVAAGNSFVTSAFSELAINTFATAATCAGSPATTTLAYAWTIEPRPAGFATLPTTKSSISIPAFTLNAGLTYTLTCTVTQGTVSTSTVLKVYVLSAAPVARISAGDSITWGITAPLELDASSSFDRDVAPPSRSASDLV